ncbi:MAG TPA: TolC family protein [Phycisphaerae bacterium]|nr:TolC family protein [Phycisphaerae bacterium]
MYKYLGLIALAIVPLACSAPHNSIDSMIARQRDAIAKLPAEDRARMVVIDPPASGEESGSSLPVGVLGLPDARRIALEANPDVHAARARLEASLARIGEARSFYFPQVAAFHNSTRTLQTSNRLSRFYSSVLPDQSGLVIPENPTLIDIVGTVVEQMRSRQTLSVGNQNSFSDHSTSLTATWLLFDGFVREARLLGAKRAYHASAMGVAEVERLLVRAIDVAYHQAQLGREQIRIAQADEQFSAEQLTHAQRNFEAGRMSRADVLNFEVRVRAAQVNVVAARGLRETGRVVLAELMALPGARLPDNVQLAELEDDGEAPLEPPDADEWIDRGMRLRPDLAQARYILEARSENVNLAKGQFSPQVSLQGSWGLERSSNLRYEERDQASAVALEVRWQLFTGGFRTSQLRRARADWWEAHAGLEGKRLEVAADVRQAVVDVVDAQEQVKLQRANLGSARENRRLVETEYRAGKLSLVRLNEAQRDLVQTEVDLARARIRLRQAWSDLRAAAGAYADDVDSQRAAATATESTQTEP